MIPFLDTPGRRLVEVFERGFGQPQAACRQWSPVLVAAVNACYPSTSEWNSPLSMRPFHYARRRS